MAARQFLTTSMRFNSKSPGHIMLWNRSISTTCVLSNTRLQIKVQKEQLTYSNSNGILSLYQPSQLLPMRNAIHEITKGLMIDSKKFTTGSSLNFKSTPKTQLKASSTLQNYERNLGFPGFYDHISSNQIYWRKILFGGFAAFFTLSLYRRQARLQLEKSLKEDKEKKLKKKKEKALLLLQETECSRAKFVSDAKTAFEKKKLDPCKGSPFCYVKLKKALKNDQIIQTVECLEDETYDCIFEDEFDDDYYALL